MAGKGSPKGVKQGGRKKGTPNKVTKALKDMILGALDDVGGQAYLAEQALANPSAFLTLAGKVLPLQIQGDKDNPLRTITEVRETIVDPGHPSSEGAETPTGPGQV